MSNTPNKTILVVSACLMGARVRYNGDHKRCSLLVEEISRSHKLIPLCPEFECGLGIPREPMNLHLINGLIRLIGVISQEDYTDPMEKWFAQELVRIEQIEKSAGARIAGFVLKAGSPSCGLKVPLYDDGNRVIGTTQGLWAQVIAENFSGLKIVDERALEVGG